MFSFCLLLFLVVQKVISLSCPSQYLPVYSENVCVHLSSRILELKDMKGYCRDEAGGGGKPLESRFSDKGLKELTKAIKITVEGLFPSEVFVGMEREKDDYNRPTDSFKYSNNEGSVKEGDYPLWLSDPTYSDCGVVSYDDDFKVKPFSCSNSAIYMCEKNEKPCKNDGSTRYFDYHGRCLGLVPRKDNFMYATSICDQLKGHITVYKTEEEADSIGENILNSAALDGGIYAGIRKRKSGEWVYGSGEEENSRWDPDDDRKMDCGVHRFLKDMSFGLYTMSCAEPLRGLCACPGIFRPSLF